MQRKIYTSKLGDKFKLVHHVVWASKDAITLLQVVLSYLVIKKSRAEIVLELHVANERAREETGGYFGNYHPLPDWLTEKRSFAFNEMKRLNAKGGRLQ